MKWDENSLRITNPGPVGTIALACGLIGLAASGYGFTIDRAQFFYSYLTAFFFWLSIALGGLFFVMLHYLANAKWSVVIRRLSENIMLALPVMALFLIPVFLGMHDLFHWTHEEVVQADKILAGKQSFLNANFFIIRGISYFVIWSLLSVYLYRKSIKQDQKHEAGFLKSVRAVSAPGMILFALTITLASVDWLMSLDPHWFSTIFGVYLFTGSFLAFLSLVAIIGRYLSGQGVLKGILTDEHYHDIGKLLFAFTIFWAYMAYSQYFLIWYADIPEETYWFLNRWVGTWKGFSMLLLFGHFVLPFLLLLPRWSKRNAVMLTIVALWILLMRWVDLYWLIFPTHSPDGVHLSWMDISTLAGIGGIFIWFVWNRITSQPLIPVNDPDLGLSIKHTNSA